MSKVQTLRAFVQQRLSAAAEEIFELFERTIAEYEEELCGQRKLLDAVFKPEVRLHRADVQLLFPSKAAGPSEQQWSSRLDQEDPQIKEEWSQEDPSEDPHVKEKQEELRTRQDCGGPGPGPAWTPYLERHSRQAADDKTSPSSEPDTEDSCDWEETRKHQSASNPLQNNTAPIGASVMKDEDLVNHLSKAGGRNATVAFCRQAGASLDACRKDALLKRLGQRWLSGVPVSVKNKALAGNTNAKKKVRRVQLGWMDYDEKLKRYKLVKTANGGGTRHLTIDKDKTAVEIKALAERLFFPNGFSKKRKKLSDYLTKIISSQVHVNRWSTVEYLYEVSQAKILRLYLRTKKVTLAPSSDEDEAQTHFPSSHLIDFTGREPHPSTELQDGGDRVHQELDLHIVIGAVAPEGEPQNNQQAQRLDGPPEPVCWMDPPMQGPDEAQPGPSAEPWNEQCWDHRDLTVVQL